MRLVRRTDRFPVFQDQRSSHDWIKPYSFLSFIQMSGYGIFDGMKLVRVVQNPLLNNPNGLAPPLVGSVKRRTSAESSENRRWERSWGGCKRGRDRRSGAKDHRSPNTNSHGRNPCSPGIQRSLCWTTHGPTYG